MVRAVRSSMVSFSVIIPARHASTRLPGKPLADIHGKPMIVRVAERARLSGAESVIIATDHREVARVARDNGLDVVMTRSGHVSGTDRIAEVVAKRAFDPAAVVVNVQGDEPLISPALIRAVARQLATDKAAAMATACHPISDPDEFLNPNVVKVVRDRTGAALYFSRAPIPWPRDAFAEYGKRRNATRTLPANLPCYRHIGVYAYRVGFLLKYSRLRPVSIEQTESLEQLRALWHGFRIAVAMQRDEAAPGVDTREDLDRVRAIFRAEDDVAADVSTQAKKTVRKGVRVAAKIDRLRKPR